jgi:hypothetical protein
MAGHAKVQTPSSTSENHGFVEVLSKIISIPRAEMQKREVIVPKSAINTLSP